MADTRSLRGANGGQTVGRYRLARALGPSPYGLEYLATHKTAGGLVAACRLLVVDADKAESPRTTLERIRPLLALSHGGMVRPIDAGLSGRDLYVAYEYQVGRDLARIAAAHRARRGGLAPAVALHVVSEVLAALAHALRNGRDTVSRTHGALRTDSVFVTADGRVRLQHFGLGHILRAGPARRDKAADAEEREAAAVADLLLDVLSAKKASPSSRGGAAGSAVGEVGARMAEAIASVRPGGPGHLATVAGATEAMARELGADPVGADDLARLLVELFGKALEQEADELSRVLAPGSEADLPPTPSPTPAPSPASPVWTPSPQTVVAERYRIVRLLGEGGMGQVVEAEHLALGRRVAVKILHPALSRDPEFAERFRREARAACRIGHQHIVDVLDFGNTPDGRLFYVMEMLDGQSLGTLIEDEGALDQRRAARIMLQLCDALDAAHEAQVVHRDLKPDNIMLSPGADGREFVRVVDFGIAQDDDPASKRVTHTGQIVGTPPYMAPEQIRGTPTDPRTDIYAAGAILYEMLTGHPPFEAETAVEVMSAHLKERPVRPRRAAPDREIHPLLEEVVLRALEKDPAERYPSMAEMAFDIWTAVEAVQAAAPPERSLKDSAVAVAPAVLAAEASGEPGRPSALGTDPTLSASADALAERDSAEPPPAGKDSGRVVLAVGPEDPTVSLSAAETAAELEEPELEEPELEVLAPWWRRLPWWAPVGLAVAGAALLAVAALPGFLRPRQIASEDDAVEVARRSAVTPGSLEDGSREAAEGPDVRGGPSNDSKTTKRRQPRNKKQAGASNGQKRGAEAEAQPPSTAEDRERVERHSKARTYLRSRNFVYAAHEYRVLVSRYPSDAVAFAGLGQAQLARGEAAEAVGHFQKAVTLRPENLSYRVMLAGALMQAGRRDEARRLVDQVLQREPDNAAAIRLQKRLQ